MSKRALQLIVIIVVSLAFAAPAFAGPIGDALREAGEVADAVEDATRDVAEGVNETVKETVTGAIRNVQAFLNAAREYAASGDQQQAAAHALAAQHEMRKISGLIGVDLPPLGKAELKKKAGKTAAFKAALAKLPPAKVLYSGSCKMPEYGWTCCPAGKTAKDGQCR